MGIVVVPSPGSGGHDRLVLRNHRVNAKVTAACSIAREFGRRRRTMTTEDPANDNPFESPLTKDIDDADPSAGEPVDAFWIFTIAIVSLIVGLSVMHVTCVGIITAQVRVLGRDQQDDSAMFAIITVVAWCVSPILGIAAAIGIFKSLKRRMQRRG